MFKKNEVDQVKSFVGGPKSFLLTGSAGHIGKALLQRITLEDHKNVVALYRKTTPDIVGPAYPFASDMLSNELLETALRGVECVVHLAWDGTGLSVSPHKTTNLLVLDNLVAAMEREGTRRIVFLSPLGAKQTSRNAFFAEKYQAELKILNSRIPEKIIIRTGLVVGGDAKTDRLSQSLRRLMKIPGFYPTPSGKNKLDIIPLGDLVEELFVIMKAPLEGGHGCLFRDIRSRAEVTIQELLKIFVEKHYPGGKLACPQFISRALIPMLEYKALSIISLLECGEAPSNKEGKATLMVKALEVKKYYGTAWTDKNLLKV